MKRINLIATALAVCLSNSTFGYVYSSGSLSDFKVTLFDTNPLDGITPYVHWGSAFNEVITEVTGIPNAGYFSDVEHGPLDGFYSAFSFTEPLSNPGNNTPVTATATLNAPHAFEGLQMHATGGISSDSGYGSFLAQSIRNLGFTVSANTIVLFTAFASTQNFIEDNQYTSWANSWESISTGGYIGPVTQGSYSYLGQVVMHTSGDRSGTLAVSFNNLSAMEQEGYFQAKVSVNGFEAAPIPAVPEPETYGMFLAGFGITVLMTRRRMKA